MEAQAKMLSTEEIPKYVFHNISVCGHRVMHKLAHLFNTIGDVGSSDGGVMKASDNVAI